jgi:hypothetical protein
MLSDQLSLTRRTRFLNKSRMSVVQPVLVLLLWYSSSTAAVLLSKHAFSDNAFPFPLTVTATNNVVAAALSLLSSAVLAHMFPSPQAKRQPQCDQKGQTRNRHRLMGYAIGATTAAEIGFANLALKRLSVSFSTLLKGAAPLSIVLWYVDAGL